jgi:hypothetical protein
LGRKKLVLTEAQIEERKQRYWGPTRNAERRKRYATDSAYRETVQAQVKESYRKARVEAGLPVRTEDCRENIDLLDTIGDERPVVLKDGGEVGMLTLTTKELATALDRNQQVLYRWYSADLLPRPAVAVKTPTNFNQPMYTGAEAEAMMQVFGRHQEDSQYYRKHHTETRKALFDAVEKVRDDLNTLGVCFTDGE